jgi:hypothetical protein
MKSACVVMFLFPAVLLGQSPDIESYLARVERGGAEEVRTEVPSLLTAYPNNPSVLYLQGVLTTDGTEAVRVYQSIVDNFPRSEWADDALYKVYQFYYAIGLYRTAEIKLNQLKTDYPQSRYLAGAIREGTRDLPEEPVSAPQPGVAAESPDQPVQQGAPIAEERESRSQPVTERGQYTLQVGAYAQQVNAEKQKLFFEDLGYHVEVINKVRDTRSLFVVLVGEYKTAEEARATGAELKRKYNISSMMITR